MMDKRKAYLYFAIICVCISLVYPGRAKCQSLEDWEGVVEKAQHFWPQYPDSTYMYGRKAAIIAEEIKDDMAYVRSLQFMGNALLKNEKFEASIDTFALIVQKTPPSFTDNKFHMGLYNNLGIAHWNLGNYEKAEESLKKALTYFTADSLIPLKPSLLSTLGNLLLDQNSPQKRKDVFACFWEAEEIACRLKDTSLLATINHNIGRLYSRENDKDAAITYYKIGLFLEEQYSKCDKYSLGISFHNLGVESKENGDFLTAYQYYLRAIDMYQEVKKPNGVAEIQDLIGDVFKQLEQPDLAINYYIQALDFFTSRNDSFRMAYTLNGIGQAYRLLNDFESADSALNLALYIARKKELKSLEATSLANFSNLFEDQGRLREALLFSKQSRFLHLNSDKKNNLIGNALKDIGRIFTNMQQFDSAEVYFNSAEKLFLQGENAPKLLELYTEWASLAFEQGNDSLKNSYNLKALAISQNIHQDKRLSNIFAHVARTESNRAADLKKGNEQLQKIQKQKDQINFQNMIMLMGGILFMGILAFIFYRSYKINKNNHDYVESLHQELQHRIKNNLSYISSLLSMQARREVKANVREAINDGRHRIHTLSILHSLLFNEKQNDMNVSGEKYISQLVSSLVSAFTKKADTQTIDLEMDIENFRIDSELIARPLGLIINELMTNIFKHVYPFTDHLQIIVRFKKIEGNTLLLVVSDSGVPNRSIESIAGVGGKTGKPISMGMKLINRIVEQQIQGTIERTYDDGLRYDIQFPIRKSVFSLGKKKSARYSQNKSPD